MEGIHQAKACCGFGHRDVYENIIDRVEKAISIAIENGCEVFYTGAMGEFDRLFSSSVRSAKKYYPHLKLICVKPYMSKEINKNGEYYLNLYDDIIIPTQLANVHYKATIKKRNQWIVDQSDYVIIYSIRKYGGAYDAMRYSVSKNKAVICL